MAIEWENGTEMTGGRMAKRGGKEE